MKVNVLVLSAFPSEMAFYDKNIKTIETVCVNGINVKLGNVSNKTIAWTHTGLGKSQSMMTLMKLLSKIKPDFAIYSGTAGAVNQNLKTGAIVLGQSCIDADLLGIHDALKGSAFEEALEHIHFKTDLPKSYLADPELLKHAFDENKNFVIGTLATSDNFPSPSDKISQLRKIGVQSIDMESSSFYQAMKLYEIPALAVRAVSNELDDSGHDEDIESANISTSDIAARSVLGLVKSFK